MPEQTAPLDDEALIEAVLRSDARRAGEIHDRLISVVDSTLFRVLGGRESDHDDLVQAAFEQIIVMLRRGRFSRESSLSTWAAALTTHVAFNALRARRRFRRLFDPSEADGGAETRSSGDTERDVGAREQIRIAQAHLAAMRPERAIVLILHDVFGHEISEIASNLGISKSAAQSRLVRGRRQLLRRLGADEGGQEGTFGGG
jgi:RNA polymerase sigma factor (sigma-70 family)